MADAVATPTTPAAAAAAPAEGAGAATNTPPPATPAPAVPAATPERKSALTPPPEPAKPAEAPKDGEKPAEQKPANDEPLKITLPEGTAIDQKLVDGFAKEAKAAGMNSEQASKVATWYTQQQAQQVAAWNKQSDDWYDQLEKDPEFGGANLAQNKADYQAAVKRFGEKFGLAAELQKFGLDNNPAIVKAFIAIGRATGEARGSVVPPTTAPKVMSEDDEKMLKMFPSLAPLMHPKQQ